MNPCLFTLNICLLIISLGLAARFLLSIAGQAWYNKTIDKVHQLTDNFDCAEFHKLNSEPRPWYVKWDEALRHRGL